MEMSNQVALMDDKLDTFATWSWVFSLQYINQMERLLRAHDMTVAQFTVLHHVTKPALRSGMTLSEISDAVEVNLPAVVKIINKFERLGLVETEILKKRGRSRSVKATPEAQFALDSMKQSMGPFLHRLFGSLDPSDAEQAAHAMKVMSEHLHRVRSADGDHNQNKASSKT